MIGEEKQIIPFIRTDNAGVRANLKKIDPSIGDETVARFARMRQLKDSF